MRPRLPPFRDIKHSAPTVAEYVCLDQGSRHYIALHRLVENDLVVEADVLAVRDGVHYWRKTRLDTSPSRTAAARAGRRIAAKVPNAS